MDSSPDFIALYKRHIPDLVGSKNSKELRGSCQFEACQGKQRDSFSVNSHNGLFICFRCNATGNAVDFAKMVEEDPRPFFDLSNMNSSPSPQNSSYYHNLLLQDRALWRPPFSLEALT